MPKRPKLVRTSITIPSDVLAQADRLAREWDRSRSWVLAEGVRRFQAKREVAEPTRVREPGVVPYPARVAGLGESRRAQLLSDMALTIEARILAAEEANRLDGELRPPCRGMRLTFFDRVEDYVEWKRWEGIIR